LPNIFDVLLAAINIMEVRITDSRIAIDQPEVLLRPALGNMRLMDFDRASEAIAGGYQIAHHALFDSAWCASTSREIAQHEVRALRQVESACLLRSP